LDTFDGICKMACGLQYAIGGCYGQDRDHMMLVSEHVCDTFTSRVFHDDTNATVVGGSMGEVPCFGGMITPSFASAGFLMHKDPLAKQCHQHGIKQEGPFQCLMCRQERVEATRAHHVEHGVALRCESAPMG
jgi:hypothetical protein